MNEPTLEIETQTPPKAVEKPKPDVRPRNALGDLISEKREMRRAIGWPSGRQWRKYRKNLRAINKEVKTAMNEAGFNV